MRKSGDWSYVGFPDGPRNATAVSAAGSQGRTTQKRTSRCNVTSGPNYIFSIV